MSGGWNISQIESLVLVSLTESNPQRKADAVTQIHALRSSPDRVAIGLELFAKASQEMIRSFGLSLLRDYLSTSPLSLHKNDPQMMAVDAQNRNLLRQTVTEWLNNVLGCSTHVPQHIKNNMLSIYTLCIKRDYPEVWPSAFHDLLGFGNRFGLVGVDVVIRVLNELEIEVVMFNENRTKDEIAHNTLIKDTMRSSSVIKDIVHFLCQAATVAASTADSIDLSGRCLLSLAEMIGWIDINLVLSDALPTIYNFLQSAHPCQRGALSCIYEIAKKGMDPVLKVELIHKIDLVPKLLAIRTDFTNVQPMIDDHDNSVYSVHKQYGLVLDMIALELLGCWSKFEDHLFPSPNPKSSFVSASRIDSVNGGPVEPPSPPQLERKTQHLNSGVAELMAIAPLTTNLLQQVIPELLNFLRHPYVTIAASVVPSGNKFIQLLKLQKFRMDAIFAFIKTQQETRPDFSFFLGFQYLDTFLFSILQQSQYPHNFKFEEVDADDEEENEILEGKREIRVLFVNCCRIYPKECLNVINTALNSLPKPLSKSPFPPLEATLRLLHCYSDSGITHAELSAGSNFSNDLAALQHTDIQHHPHVQVQLVFFEISVRYVKLLPDAEMHLLAHSLFTHLQQHAQANRSKNQYFDGIRSKFAALAVKLAEGLETKSFMLLQFAEILQGLIAINNQKVLQNYFNNERLSVLSDTGEVNIYAVIGSMISTTPPDNHPEFHQIRNTQVMLFQRTTEYVFQFINQILSYYHAPGGGSVGSSGNKELVMDSGTVMAMIAKQINALSALIKNIPKQSRQQYQTALEEICRYICKTLLPFTVSLNSSTSSSPVPISPHSPASVSSTSSSTSLRGKIIVFLHHMITLLDESSIAFLGESLLVLIRTSEMHDMEAVIQLLNQFLNEYESKCIECMMILFPEVLTKYQKFMVTIDAGSNSATDSSTQITEAPHIETERVLLIKQLLQFIHHLVSYHNTPVFYQNQANVNYVPDILEILLRTLKGLSPLGKKINYSSSLGLRRTSLVILSNLLNKWLFPVSSSTMGVGVSSTVGSGSATPTQDPTVLSSIQEMFNKFLRDQYIPIVFIMLGQPNQQELLANYRHFSQMVPEYNDWKLNNADAATQGVITEIAGLLFCIVRKNPVFGTPNAGMDDFGEYLKNLLTSMHWSPMYITQMCEQLYNPTIPLGNFKDSMKQFARQVLR